MRISKPLILSAIVLAAICLRIWVFSSVDRLLPLEGLYVDEKTYSMSPFIPGVEGFSRPPGMFVMSMLMNVQHNVTASRIFFSLLSLLPALALYLAFRKRGGAWLYICTAGLILSPFMTLFGFQLLPAVPAAVLIAFTLLSLKRGRTVIAGFLAGIVILFRAEYAIVPLFLFAFSFRNHLREWMIFTASAAIAVIPIIILNLSAGAGPVIASNGGENLWLGTDWELITTPPGTEFEELVSTGDSRSGGDEVFLDRAFNTIGISPFKWLSMGGRKLLAFFTLPGPGRNSETGWLLQGTWLIMLLPLTLLAMSAGTAGFIKRGKNFWQSTAASFICSGIVSAFIFFPSARFRLTVLPACWFLAASLFPDRKYSRLVIVPAVIIVIISLLVTYPGMERSGLTSMLAAEYLLDSGKLTESAEYLRDAEERGYFGSDLHNLRGVLVSLSGNPGEGAAEFEKALEIAPGSPTLWKNYAVSLWSNCRYRDSVDAARRAVFLNPLLREQLRPILEHAENL
ncbi:MAG: tetratricopeptide repeat protein [Candidatus Aegiribacteria sp.]|nr:tetratricopeptide repeat protein [Candidatus Aegiribacteria sp.]